MVATNLPIKEMMNIQRNILGSAAILVAALTMVIGGCNGGSSTGPSGRDDYAYTLNGLAIKDLAAPAAMVAAQLERNDSILATASVSFGGDALVYTAGAYQRQYSPASQLQTGSHILSIVDDTLFGESVSAVLPDSLAVEVVDPASRINPAGMQITISWTAATGTEGYAAATVRKDQIYTGEGYSAWVTSQVTGTTVPPEAFRWSNGLNVDTGWYYIYVYAYTGAPDVALADGYLPVELPSQLADNIDYTDFSGRFGAVTVSPYDSVYVTTR